MKQNTRMLAALLGSVWFLCPATPAHAIAIFEFDISYLYDDYAGQQYTGTITTDSIADGRYNPSGSFGHTLLSFHIDAPYAFDATDAVGFPSAPLVDIASGDIASISYNYFDGENELELDIDYNPAAGRNEANLFDGGDDGFGYVSATRYIPEPGTLALLSIGLAGMGFTRRRMKS